MKDPNDKTTIDGFADLVTQFEEKNGLEPGSVLKTERDLEALIKWLDKHIDGIDGGPKKRPGRKPQGDVALTPAQKQKAYRDRKRERLEAIKAGEPVESKLIDLTTDFATAYKARTTSKDGA